MHSPKDQSLRGGRIHAYILPKSLHLSPLEDCRIFILSLLDLFDFFIINRLYYKFLIPTIKQLII